MQIHHENYMLPSFKLQIKIMKHTYSNWVNSLIRLLFKHLFLYMFLNIKSNANHRLLDSALNMLKIYLYILCAKGTLSWVSDWCWSNGISWCLPYQWHPVSAGVLPSASGHLVDSCSVIRHCVFGARNPNPTDDPTSSSWYPEVYGRHQNRNGHQKTGRKMECIWSQILINKGFF